MHRSATRSAAATLLITSLAIPTVDSNSATSAPSSTLALPPRVRSGTGAPTYRPSYEAAVVDALATVLSSLRVPSAG